jgi:hypothetical protein
MSQDSYHGAIPAYPARDVQTSPHFVANQPDNSGGPKTWQVVGGFLSAAAIIVGGVWGIATTVFVDKETYLRERTGQAEVNAQLQAAMERNTNTNVRLERVVEKLDTSLDELQEKLSAIKPGRR